MADQNIYDMNDTWNSGATTFDFMKANVTDTASAAESNLANLQVGGTTKYRVRKDGSVIAAGNLIHAKGADVASAGALALGTDGLSFDITGVTAVTSISSLGVGALAILQFDGALTLTHHATDLVLPGGVNITTAAGDIAVFYEYASGDWRCLSYQRAAGAVHVGKGADVASASTVTLGEGNFFHITGTTTITDIDFANAYDGRWALLEFDGALTLTHNATTLVLPGGQDIVTAAGDTCFIVQDSSDNVHVAMFTRAAVIPYVAGSFTPTYRAGGSSTGVTYTTQSGNYIRIGKAVWFSLRVTLSNAGSASGAVSIAGLPFSSGTINYPVSIGPVSAAVSLTSALSAYVSSSSTSVSIVQWGATGTSAITQANINNTFDVIINGYYEAGA